MQYIHWPSETVLKNLNRFLLVIIIAVNGYVLVMPLLPKVNYEVKKRVTKPVRVDPARKETVASIDRSRNHLILPTIQLDEPIYDGVSSYTVNKGIWRRPNTSTPDRGGNTVLVGHRFTYNGAAVFYNLDKLGNNDDIYLIYSQKVYHYKVALIQIVSPNNTQVEAPSAGNRLTIYTCTPLLTAKNRLVYIADLIEVN